LQLRSATPAGSISLSFLNNALRGISFAEGNQNLIERHIVEHGKPRLPQTFCKARDERTVTSITSAIPDRPSDFNATQTSARRIRRPISGV
jgi:hypothetical protein